MKKTYSKLAGVAAVLACVASGPALAQAGGYPSKPVRLVVGYAPGGTTDISARMIADVLGKEFGQTFVVENKPGANSNIGAESVARSPADGYTLFVGSISTAINQSLYSKMSYDALKDLDAVALLNVVPNILAVNASVPVKTVQEYIDYAKKNPGKLTCASPGNGSSAHLGCELFKMKTGIDILHVPYRGSGPAVADLLGGQVDSIFDNLPPLLPHVRAGKLTGLAVTTGSRVPFAPEIPTIAESGVAGFDVARRHSPGNRPEGECRHQQGPDLRRRPGRQLPDQRLPDAPAAQHAASVQGLHGKRNPQMGRGRQGDQPADQLTGALGAGRRPAPPSQGGWVEFPRWDRRGSPEFRFA